MPTLYVVATPIGNLEDITLRALRVLGEVDLIAAEDTRVTRRLLGRHNIHTPLTSYHEHNKLRALPRLLRTLSEKDVALVSDAGMPGISDPGSELVSAAIQAGATVVPIPGPSAVTSAIAVSGMAVDQFVYLGFLPRTQAARRRLLESLAEESRAVLAFETPHRLRRALDDVHETLGDRRIVVCRELTKLHEEIFRGTVSEAVDHFVRPRGEFTLVIGGAEETADEQPVQEQAVRDLLAGLKADGARVKDAVAQAVRETGLPRSRVYRIWLEIGRQTTRGDDRVQREIQASEPGEDTP